LLTEKKRSLEVFKRYSGALEESELLDLIMEERKRFLVREFDL